MPLTKGKSQKTFVKNLKTELEHGKPMKQSLAIAYSMKRKAKKMADGGEIKLDPDKVNDFVKGFTGHAKGGVISDKERYQRSGADKGMSPQGGHVRSSNRAGDWAKDPRASGPSIEREMSKESMRKAKEIAAEKLYAEHDRPKPKLKGLAFGGELESGYESLPEEHEIMNRSAESEDDLMLNQHGADEEGPEGRGLVDRIMRKRMSEGGKVANDTEPFEEEFETPDEFDDLVLRDDLESNYGEGDNSGDELGNASEDERRHDIVSKIMASRRKKDRLPSPK